MITKPFAEYHGHFINLFMTKTYQNHTKTKLPQPTYIQKYNNQIYQI